MLCRVAAVKHLPVHHHSADYMFWSFGIIGFILSQFENRVPLKPVLVGRGGGVAWAVLHHYVRLKKRVFCFRFFDVFLASRESSFRTYFVVTAAGVVPCEGGRKTSPRISS